MTLLGGMIFSITSSVEILRNTPKTIEALLGDIDAEWVLSNEGPDTFSPFDVLGHLIHGEKTDWRVRIDMILSNSGEAFPPYDRFAQYQESKGKDILQLMDEFKQLRIENLRYLEQLNIGEADLNRKGIHPALGEVTLRNLIATWVVHDLSHLAQIARVMGKQYSEHVGAWFEYLPMLSRP